MAERSPFPNQVGDNACFHSREQLYKVNNKLESSVSG